MAELHHHHHHHLHLPRVRFSPDAVIGIATGITLCGVTGVLFTVTFFPVDIEKAILLLLFSLGYVMLPFLAVALLLRSLAAGPYSVSDGFPTLGPAASRLVYPLALVNSVEKHTRLVTAGTCEGEEQAEQCAVCLEDVKPGQTARMFSCNHVFHTACADAWLLQSRKNCCPLCLRRVCPDRDADMNVLPEAKVFFESEDHVCS